MQLHALLKIFEIIAREKADGHYTIMKFTTDWRVMLGTPTNVRKDITEKSYRAETLEIALELAIEGEIENYGQKGRN